VFDSRKPVVPYSEDITYYFLYYLCLCHAWHYFLLDIVYVTYVRVI